MDLVDKIKEEIENRIHNCESQVKLQLAMCDYQEAARYHQSEKCYRSLLEFINTEIEHDKWKQNHG